MRRGRITTGVLLWLVAAAAASAVAMTAVSAIGSDIFGAGRSPLSQSEVDERLRARSTAPATSEPTAPPAPAAGPARTVSTAGGSVIARCVPGGVRVVSVVPAQGFRVDPEDDPVDDHPTVTFESDGREVEVRFRCVDGVPRPEIEDD